MTTITTPAWSDTTFTVMGSTARVLVHGGPDDLAAEARARLEDLETRWSRFRPDSELCRLNEVGDRPLVVSRETFDVVTLAITAWRATGGRFDPTVLDALTAAGYDRDFAAVADDPAAAPDEEPGPAPGCEAIELDRLVPAIRLPAGVHLDLGGIGKGYAADLVAAELVAAGADGVCVNLGGDLTVAGQPLEGDGWQVDLDPMLAPGWSFRLARGSVATSTRLRRRWTRDGATHHHLIDPGTGRPAWSGLAAVTVLAASAAWAEVLAKAAFVAGREDGIELLAARRATGLFVRDDGEIEPLPGLDAFVG